MDAQIALRIATVNLHQPLISVGVGSGRSADGPQGTAKEGFINRLGGQRDEVCPARESCAEVRVAEVFDGMRSARHVHAPRRSFDVAW